MSTDQNKFVTVRRDPSSLKHGKLTEQIIGAFYEVYNELGYGFLETVYRESLRLALVELGLCVGVEVPIPVTFNGHLVGQRLTCWWTTRFYWS